MVITRNMLLGLVVPAYILISCQNKMLEFRKPRFCPAPVITEAQTSAGRQGLEPRRDLSLGENYLTPLCGLRNQNSIIYVREKLDTAGRVKLASKNTRRKMKRKNKIDVLPAIVE